MIVLSIDTCGTSGTVALGRVEPGSVSVLAQTELPGKTYSAQLVPAIRTMLAAEVIDPATLDAVLAVNGPGSFTGIRVGVSAAKGLAETLSIPLAAVSRLAVLAWKAQAEAAALDAGRSELYFRDGARETLVASKELASSPPAALAVCEPAVHWIFPEAILIAPPTAADALNFAAPLLLSGEFADTATLDGNYVRRSDAEIFAKSSGKPCIRSMTAADLDPVIGLAASIPEAPRWPRSGWGAFVSESPRRIFLAESGGELTGFLAGQIVGLSVGCECELESVAVTPAHRRSGVATALLQALLDWARQHGASKVQLEVRSTNTSAVAFYKHHGFHPDGLRPRYYRDPEDDALLMTLPLAPPPQP